MRGKGEMSQRAKQISNPFSTGGGGGNFETRVQAAFVALMLTGGFAPCLLPLWPIKKIKLQGKYAGYDTDDLIVFAKSPDSEKEVKLLGQIKHFVKITERDKVLGEVIQSAWSDFKNLTVFKEGSDVIALITGPLSSTDIMDVRTILEWARHSEDATDFLTKVDRANFSSNAKRNKLKAFRIHLKKANSGIDVSDDELWRFMKSFHLIGYDLDIKAGVTISLLQSLICQYSQENVYALWTQIVYIVQSANQNAGTITIDSLPEELRSSFQRRVVETIPADFARTLSVPATIDWNHVSFASEVAITNLLGSWYEKSEADTAVAGQLANEEFATWLSKIREILQQSKSPLTLKNGKWAVAKRLEMWQTLGPRLFDDHLGRFQQCVIRVLTERDPQFELRPEERYAASIHGKVLTHSDSLRKGLVESLALLGSHPKALTNCSLNKPETTAIIAVREILDGADWILWGSMNNLLPMLAEAAPGEFLSMVESALQRIPCPFDELFSQEGNGITGGNYMTGLLWALETLAWDEQYLSRVAVILGELATHDPGGNYANRPANSLTTIFLPWLPQTIASVEKRKAAIQTLQKEVPEIGWTILLSLLPNQHQMSTGSHKPVWRGTIPEDWAKGVSQQEYWDQVSCYADMAVEIANTDIVKLTDLIGHLHNLPQPALDNLLVHLESDKITSKPEEERLPLWTKLIEFVSKHKKYADEKWALSPELVERINRITESLAPESPLCLYQRLFKGRDHDLYEKDNWEVQQNKLDERRQNAIREIVTTYDLGILIEFAESVESSLHVGLSLGFVAEEIADSAILPELLNTDKRKLSQFVSGFVWGRYRSQGWVWVDKVDTSDWSTEQKGQFLVCLPFTNETWVRSVQLLGKNESAYWSKVSVNPHQTEDTHLDLAIDKLIEYDRPNAAISCLSKTLHDKKPLDQARTVKALLAAVSSREPAHSIDVYDIAEIIKALQDDPNTNPDDLFQVEWVYLPLLDRYHGASPKFLEQRLVSHPDFFCEVISLVYRSNNEERANIEPTEQQKVIAANAYRLLHEWQTPPGMQPNRSFSGDYFNKWLDSVKTACSESGHLEVALSHIGNVLIYSPSDPAGLWIHHAAAAALNAKDAGNMRSGFRMGIVNSRGAHWIDPTGKPERELAAKYRQQASDVENHGYQRLAATLRGVADSYDREAERNEDGQ
jgi:hypothetical protein